MPATKARSTGKARGSAIPRAIVVCPLAACAKVTVRPSREAALQADRQHWQRVHASSH